MHRLQLWLWLSPLRLLNTTLTPCPAPLPHFLTPRFSPFRFPALPSRPPSSSYPSPHALLHLSSRPSPFPSPPGPCFRVTAVGLVPKPLFPVLPLPPPLPCPCFRVTAMASFQNPCPLPPPLTPPQHPSLPLPPSPPSTTTSRVTAVAFSQAPSSSPPPPALILLLLPLTPRPLPSPSTPLPLAPLTPPE